MDFPWNKPIINHPAIGISPFQETSKSKNWEAGKTDRAKPFVAVAVSRNPSYKMLQDIKSGLSLSSQPFFRPAYDPSSLAWNNKEEGHVWPDDGRHPFHTRPNSDFIFSVDSVGHIQLWPWLSVISTKKTPFIEGSLEVKLPTIWTDEKQSREEAERRERLEERRSEEKESEERRCRCAKR